jgi:broad specificity phosphatase PhoE
VSAEITLLRHARTEANDTGAYMGDLDTPASDESLREAASMAGALGRRADAVVVTSPLRRAVATAAAIFPAHDVRVDHRLRERSLGEWQGMSHASVRSQWPQAFNADGPLDPRYTPPGGEEFAEFVERVAHFINESAQLKTPLIVVSHNGWIRTAQYVTGAIALTEIFAESIPYLVPLRLSLSTTSTQAG